MEKHVGSCVVCAQSHGNGNERRRNAFEISAKRGNGFVATQTFFVDALEETQIIANIFSLAFNSIGMNFSNAITVIVTSPFMIDITQ